MCIRDRELFTQGIVPKVSLSGKQMEIKKLSINRDAKTIIQRVPEEWPKLEAFMAYFNLAYKGQGLPACTQEALLAQCQVKRKPIPSTVKSQLLLEQEHKCSICGSQLDNLCQVDHIAPLCQAVDELSLIHI